MSYLGWVGRETHERGSGVIKNASLQKTKVYKRQNEVNDPSPDPSQVE